MGYDETSRTTKALERKREFKNAKDLITLMFMYLTGGYSQITPSYIISYSMPGSLEGYKIVALDASTVTEKGSTKRIFRLHYAIDLMKMCAVSFKL